MTAQGAVSGKCWGEEQDDESSVRHCRGCGVVCGDVGVVGILPAQMSRVIRSLEAKHGKPLIDCSINPEDKRRIDVCRTEAGVKAHATYRSSRLMATVAILAELTQKDRNEFMRLLRLSRGHLAKQLS